MTPRQMERQLREQGYSRKAAKTAVAAMRLTGNLKQQPKPKKHFWARICNALTGE